MKRLIKETKNNGGALAMLVNGVNLLPFAGVALLIGADTAGIVFGMIFLIIGLLMWAVTLN